MAEKATTKKASAGIVEKINAEREKGLADAMAAEFTQPDGSIKAEINMNDDEKRRLRRIKGRWYPLTEDDLLPDEKGNVVRNGMVVTADGRKYAV